MSKDKRFLNMALAIHKIAFSVDDETLNKIDPYLKEIESIINSICEEERPQGEGIKDANHINGGEV